ncbi:putative membrane-associated kinase regulator 1 [Abeliophyllum distichum]|uniref:Membrane-associated kinase regulator 1 n=1 Tax=Abeliophyllum distichum TaxID=126358 RepID=A0ABD1RF10_9LAMI
MSSSTRVKSFPSTSPHAFPWSALFSSPPLRPPRTPPPPLPHVTPPAHPLTPTPPSLATSASSSILNPLGLALLLRMPVEDFKCINNNVQNNIKKSSKYFSFSRFSSVFRKEPKNSSSSSSKSASTSAKEVISKYLKKVKPLYEKISQKQQLKVPSSSLTKTTAAAATVISTRMARSANPSLCMKTDGSIKEKDQNTTISLSFSGNMRRYARRRSCISSCPSSVRSSPNHSRILCRNEFTPKSSTTSSTHYADTSSMEDLQSAIQGAIAHCKNSMLQDKTHGQ